MIFDLKIYTGGDNKQVVEKTVTRDRDNVPDRLLGQTQSTVG
jgi:hypothetical protein